MHGRTGTFGAGLGVAGVVLGLALVLRAGAWGLLSPDRSGILLDAVGAACTAGSAIVCLGFGVEHVDRRAWRWLGVAMGLWALADLTWLGLRIGGVEAPYPSAADALYLLGLLPMAIGLAKLRPGVAGHHDDSRRVLMDTAVLGAAMALVIYLLVLRPVVGQLGLTLEMVLSVLYPVTDMLMAAFVCALVLRRDTKRARWDLLLLAAGYALYTLVDSAFTVFDATGRDYDDGLLSVAYILPPLAFVLGALRARTSGERGLDVPSRRATAWSVLLPDAAVCLAVVVCAAVRLHGWVDWAIVGSMLMLTTLRQFSLAAENERTQGWLERRVVERTSSLIELADQNQKLLDSMGEGVLGIDEDDSITFANPAATRMLGGNGVELVGARSCAFTCTRVQPDAVCLLDEVRLSGSPAQLLDEHFQRVDGTLFPVEITAGPQRGAGSAQGVVLVFRDVSEKHVLARLKTEFVSAVSHELRTPLTAIQGSLEMLADGSVGELSPVAQRMVDSALRGSSRLTRLVSDIINVERLESGTFSINASEQDLAPIVTAAVGGLRVLSEEAGVGTVLDLREGAVMCDADRIVQAVVNLVGNAVKFSPAGGTLRISVRSVGDEVQFSVSDEGRGIPAGDLELIFERFHQVSPGDAREKAGTGLGLTITKSIIERHGGRLWVESEPGHGSTFRFALPAVVLTPRPDADVLTGQS